MILQVVKPVHNFVTVVVEILNMKDTVIAQWKENLGQTMKIMQVESTHPTPQTKRQKKEKEKRKVASLSSLASLSPLYHVRIGSP